MKSQQWASNGNIMFQMDSRVLVIIKMKDKIITRVMTLLIVIYKPLYSVVVSFKLMDLVL